MNKQGKRLALSMLTFLASTMALIYTFIEFHDSFFAILGMSIVFLASAFLFSKNLIIFSTMQSKSTHVQIRDYINDLSTQIESINRAQSQIGKATYLYTRQASQTISNLENHYNESQEILYKNLVSLSSAQNKAAKLMIKYDQSNTIKVISSIKNLRNHMSETMTQGFEQFQPDNSEVIAILEDIVNCLKSLPTGMDPTLGVQINNVAHELQNISNSIQNIQIPVSASPLAEQAAPVVSDGLITDTESADIPDIISETSTHIEEDIPSIQTDTVPTDSMVSSADKTSAAEENEQTFTPTFTVIDNSIEEEALTANETISTIGDLPSSPDKQLSPDEIAALFAASEPVQMEETTPAAAEEATDAPVPENPNKQLSQDEIAALFTNSEIKEEPEPAPAVPIPDDPNKQLSPDEIAALISSLG